MSRKFKISVPAILFCLCLAASSAANAQGFNDDRGGQRRDESWYYQQQPTAYQPNPRAIIHQKAQSRAFQRESRLASMSWYGMSNARPIAAPTPFTSNYSPAWQMPGGRPFAWNPGSPQLWQSYVR